MIEIYLENVKQNVLSQCCPLIADQHALKAPFTELPLEAALRHGLPE
jgi:hypothetical protein